MNIVSTPLYQYLQSISNLSVIEFDLFASLLKPMNLKKGDYFARQGRVENMFGVLTGGVVRTYYRSDKGEEYIKSFGTPLSFVGGFSSLISGSKNDINVQALADCTILVGKYIDVTNLYHRHKGIETLARRLVESLFVNKENREIELLSLTAEQRYLLFRDHYPGLESKIPQYHIASYLGITPTQLSRIRRNLLSN